MTVYEQNVQRATRAELWEPGEEVRLIFSPSHSSPSKPAASRHRTCRSRAASPRAARPCPRHRPASHADGSSSAAHSPSRRSASGRFLAATAGKGTDPPPSAAPPLASAPPVPPQRGPSAAASASAEASAEPIASRPPATGTLRFANWIGYIDIDRGGDGYPTIVQVHDGDRDQGRLRRGHRRQRDLLHGAACPDRSDAGLPTEWDLVVMTDWMIARLIRLGWLETIDQPTPNFPANLLDIYHGRSFDPNTNLAAP